MNLNLKMVIICIIGFVYYFITKNQEGLFFITIIIFLVRLEDKINDLDKTNQK